MADPTRLELATSAVTGRRSNQLSYESNTSSILYCPQLCKTFSLSSLNYAKITT